MSENPQPTRARQEADLRIHANNLHRMAANYGSHTSTGIVASVAAFAIENFLDALAASSPASQEPVAKVTSRYMRAYYHEFEPTGMDRIDAILEAVAMAGRAYHSTELWDEAPEFGECGYWTLIQERAVAAATPETPGREDALREALKEAEVGLAAVIRLSEMGYAESMKEPEENGNFASFERADRALANVRAALAQPGPDARDEEGRDDA